MESLRSNTAFALVLSLLPRHQDMAAQSGAFLCHRTQDERYVSSLSPRLALSFMRAASRSRLASLNELVHHLLEYYLHPGRISNIPTEVAVGMLTIAQSQKFRALVRRFCDEFAKYLRERREHDYVRREHGYVGSSHEYYHFLYHDRYGSESTEVLISILEVASRYGSLEARQVFYKYGMQFWLHGARPKLVGSFVRFARTTDDGVMLINAIRNTRGIFGPNLRRSAKSDLAGLLMRFDLDRLSLDTVRQLYWLADSIGDNESLARLSSFAGLITATAPAGDPASTGNDIT